MTRSDEDSQYTDLPPPELRAHFLDHIGEAVIATDLDGTIIYWNHEAEDLYGFDRQEALGRSIYDITVPAVSRSQAEEIMRRLQAGETWSGEFEVQRRSGERFPAQVTDVPVLDEEGRLWAIVGVSSDLTERRKEEQRLEERLEQLVEANEAKDAFLGLLSHELRRPISYLLGHAEILNKYKDRLDQEVVTQSLLDMRDGARHLDRIISDLLILARPEMGDQIELEPVPLHHLVESLVEEHYKHYAGRRIEVHAPENASPALAHPTYVEHTLRNLLHNAEKYSPSSEPIQITVEEQEHDGSLKISVEDRGEGVAEEEREKIFEPFYRSTATKDVEGTGVGLAVCKRLVELQRGEIWAEPRADGGTAFRFTLPIASD